MAWVEENSSKFINNISNNTELYSLLSDTPNRAELPIIMHKPATAQLTPGILSPTLSDTAPNISGAAIYVASPNARGSPNTVASAPTGAVMSKCRVRTKKQRGKTKHAIKANLPFFCDKLVRAGP